MTNTRKRGRPCGAAHPMPMQEFWVLVLSQLPEQGMMRTAYVAAEIIVVQRYGRARFRSYGAFRNAKSKFYRLKTKKKPVI